MPSVTSLRDDLLSSDGFEVIENLRAFDNAYHSYKYHHEELVDTIQSGDATQYELSTKLVAYSGSISPLRDQANQLKERMSKKSQEEYQERLMSELNLEVSDFLIELRHYIQHTHIPYLASDDDVPVRLFGESVPEAVCIDIRELQQRGREFKKDKAIQFIENTDGRLIQLKPLLKEYFDSALEFNRWVADTYRQEHSSEIEHSREIIQEMIAATQQ